MNEKWNSNNNNRNKKRKKIRKYSFKKIEHKEEQCGDFLINNESLLQMPHNIKHRIY